MGNWLEALRDRVIVRSQVGKRKLDAAFTRRALDRKLADLGEKFLGLARDGRLAVPGDVAGLFTEARQLKEALEAQHEEGAARGDRCAGEREVAVTQKTSGPWRSWERA